MKKIENNPPITNIHKTSYISSINEKSKDNESKVINQPKHTLINTDKNIHSIDNILMLQNFSGSKSGFIKEIIPLLSESYERFNQIQLKDKEIVMVCGDTGSGKSTLINYLDNKPLQVVPSDFQKLPVLECKSEITKIGHGLTSETFVPNRCIVGEKIFWDCPGFEDTSGPVMDIANAYSVSKIKEKAENIKVLAVIEESSITGARRGQAFRDMIIKLDKMFLSHPSLKDSTVLCFTKANNIKDYELVLSKIVSSKSDLNKSQLDFLKSIIEQRRFVVCSTPQEQDIGKLYDTIYRDQLHLLIDESLSLKNPKVDPVISPKSILPINELREYANDEIKSRLENILVTITGNFKKVDLGLMQEISRSIFDIKTAYDNNKYERDIDMITNLESISKSIYNDDSNQHFGHIKFLSTQVLESITGKFIPTSEKIEFITYTEPFLEFSRNVCKHLIANGYNKQEAFDFIQQKHLSQKPNPYQNKY